jgi:hypothetical protein
MTNKVICNHIKYHTCIQYYNIEHCVYMKYCHIGFYLYIYRHYITWQIHISQYINVRCCFYLGACGTCAVKVLAGKENIGPQSKNEINTLKGKPADLRLSCCSKVSGPISIKLKP